MQNFDQEVHLDYIPFPNPDVYIQVDDRNDIVLVNLDSGHSLALNLVGKFIWEAADGKTSVTTIIQQVIDTFDCVPEEVEKDVLTIVAELKADGFLGSEIPF